MLILLLAGIASARLLHSLPEDTYAFPKYNVLFLNNLPLLNHTAHHWLHNPPSPSEFLGLESGDSSQSSQLELLKMGRDSYLCLIPEPLHLPPPPEEVQDESALTPAHSWSLLQPLTGTCLYHRQGWFTYSYCHNDQIRQFKELIQPHSHIPEEDPSWESYTLGKAPTTETDLSVSQQQNENSNALQLARGGGSRYLVQTWTDGTICDKTGKGREVEVQFHCSMAMSDTVLFVKEVKTCSYVLVINTPRLCGEPGFKSHRDVTEQAHIRCREIVDHISQEYHPVPDTDHPQKIPKLTKSLPSASKPKSQPQQQQPIDAVLRKALEAFMGNPKFQEQTPMVLQDLSDDGEVVIEFLEDVEDETLDKIVDALQAAGIALERRDDGDDDDEHTSE
ncbi:Protein OS-9 [Stygiomarasmius scandens]|uniref:Protein OS-9 homolog n=1 Tax=Marasmiellus scandens TaxID=2682957 RepID=A0ABR1JVY6_9AGAR